MANGDDTQITCKGKGGVLVCGGVVLTDENRADQARANHCKNCANARTAQTDAVKYAACIRRGIKPYGDNWDEWRALPKQERDEILEEEWVLVRSGHSTACQKPAFNLTEEDKQPVAPVAEQENPAINVSEEDAEWLTETNPAPPENEAPAGQAATSGIIYLGENRSAWTGWVMSGKTSGSNRLGGYQTGSPYRDYDFIATARVEEGLSDAEDRLQDALDAQATQRGVPSDTGDSEWFEIDRDLAVEILRELDGITGFRDLRIGNGD